MSESTKMTGASALVKALEASGVDVMFGIPGGAILPAYDPIFDSKIRHILVRHEQGAGHAATGYAQATGRTGVCIATSGPGATNLVTRNECFVIGIVMPRISASWKASVPIAPDAT